MTGDGPLVMASSRMSVICQEAAMESMKFAAHQRGSARTLTLVPRNRLGVVNGAEAEAQPPPPPMRSLNAVAPSTPSAPSTQGGAGGESTSAVREAGVRTVTCRAGQKFFGPE